MSEFDFIDKDYSVSEIDEMAKEYIELKNKKSNLQDEIKDIDSEISELEQDIIEAMKENLKTNWDAHGFKLILKKEKFPKMSKDPKDVQAFANYLEDKGGEDMLWSYMSVNHNTLRSLCKQLLEENPNEQIPSVDLSYERESLNMRKISK